MANVPTSSLAARPNPDSWLRVGVVAVLWLAMVAAWLMMMNRAGDALYFEPTTAAVALAAAVRPAGVAWALVEVAVVVALAVMARWRWLALLAVPGLVVAVSLLIAPTINGRAFLLGLAASPLSVAGVGVAAVMQKLRGRRPRRRRGRD